MFYDCVACLVGPCNEVYGMLLLWILAGEAMSRERERERERKREECMVVNFWVVRAAKRTGMFLVLDTSQKQDVSICVYLCIYVSAII